MKSARSLAVVPLAVPPFSGNKHIPYIFPSDARPAALVQAAAHAVKSGDSHGGGSSVNLSESD